MKFLIKAYDKEKRTLYQVQSDDITIIEDRALLYKAQGLDYKIYADRDSPGFTEIELTGKGQFEC